MGQTMGSGWFGWRRGAAAFAWAALAASGAWANVHTGDGTLASDAATIHLNTPTALLAYTEPSGAAGEALLTKGDGPANMIGLPYRFDGYSHYVPASLASALSTPILEPLAAVAVVPEPAATTLLGMGIGLIALRVRRRNAVRSLAG